MSVLRANPATYNAPNLQATKEKEAAVALQDLGKSNPEYASAKQMLLDSVISEVGTL